MDGRQKSPAQKFKAELWFIDLQIQGVKFGTLNTKM